MKNKNIGSTIDEFINSLPEDEQKELDCELIKAKQIEASLKRDEENLEEFLNEIGCDESYPKKNIRIYYYQQISEREIHIADFEVVEFNCAWFESDPERAKKINRLYKLYSDKGNAYLDGTWEWYDLSTLIYDFFVTQEFINDSVRIKALRELTKIKEMRIEVAKILWKYTDEEPN